MKKNESNERFDEVKAKMEDASKAFETGFETAKAVGAEAGERLSKFISGAKEKYGPKLNTLKDNVVDYYKKFVEDVDNANIYTYLMNTVQSKYQCYIVFDTENLYINILCTFDYFIHILLANIF